MKILVDENVPKMTVASLRQKGHDVRDIRGTPKEGCADSDVWRMARSEGRLLITTDKWFANHRLDQHNGILIILLKHPNRMRIHHRVIGALENFAQKDWPGQIVIVRDTVQSVWRLR